MGRKPEVKSKNSKESFQVGDIWRINNRVWYSERLVREIIDLCKRTKEACEDDVAKNLLADNILKLLDYKNSKGE